MSLRNRILSQVATYDESKYLEYWSRAGLMCVHVCQVFVTRMTNTEVQNDMLMQIFKTTS